MGLFSKKPTLASMLDEAYRTKQTVGSCHVVGETMYSISITTYDKQQPILFDLAKRFGKEEIPVRFTYDLKSQYQPSIGVYFGDTLVGWVKKVLMPGVIDHLEVLPKGASIVGHLSMETGTDQQNAPYAVAHGWIYADIDG